MKTPTKGIIFYTDNQLNLKIARNVRRQIKTISENQHIPIVSASLKKMDFGDKNICFPSLKKGHLTMFKQILGALENSTADVIFFCEHDILYHPSHFDFTPPQEDIYYYNTNVWKVRASDGHAVRIDDCKQVSGLCAYREFLTGHYRRRIARIEQNRQDLLAQGLEVKNDGFSKHMGYEPGLHWRYKNQTRGVDNYQVGCWQSIFPNIDIRHDKNLSKSRWDSLEFHNQQIPVGWTESDVDNIPGWKNLGSLVLIK